MNPRTDGVDDKTAIEHGLALPYTAHLANGPLTTAIEQLVVYVGSHHALGNRAARRFVGRNLTQETLDNWRAYGVFPVRGRIHDDSGRYAKRLEIEKRARRRTRKGVKA